MRVGSFGQTIFEVSADRVLSPTAFSREVKARYEEHKVLGAPPRLEFLAGELPNMELSVRFHASFGINHGSDFRVISPLERLETFTEEEYNVR